MRDGREFRCDRPNLMDVLSDILRFVRPSDYGFRGIDTAGAWALMFPSASCLRCFAIESGRCWLRLSGGGDTLALQSGDVVLLNGRHEVCLFSCANAEPIEAMALLSSVPVGEITTLNGGGETLGLGGFFALDGAGAEILFAALPPLIHVGSDSSRLALHAGVKRLMDELSRPRPGGALLASHLAQALLVEALRAHLESGTSGRGWLAALSDPALSRAISAMHGEIARRWTVSALAITAGMSRSRFAERFERVTGETPIGYLTRWRMVVAADRLTRPGSSLADVAVSVGYESESAFGATFRRLTGCSPRRYRMTVGRPGELP